MSQLQNNGHRHLSSFSANEGYTCSSSFALEQSVINVESEVDFKDSWQNVEKPSQAHFKASLKNDSTDGQKKSKVELTFEDLKQKNTLGIKTNLSDGTICEKLLKNELSCPEDGEVVETDEASADLEEGEIQETPNEKSVDTYNCRYYQMGFCLYGKDCRFFHISDKGLYNMIDLSVSVQNNVHRPSQSVLKQKGVSVPSVSKVGETSWDRDLKEAMDRVDSKKKVSLSRENLRMTIQSVDCIDKKLAFNESMNSSSQTYVRKTRGSSRSRRKPDYEMTYAKSELSAKDRIDMRCSFKRSKTPRDMRWSPKSCSCSSESRSRSRSSCGRFSSNCSCTASPKRDRRILSSRVSSSYWKRNASSSSKSSSRGYVSKTSSRRFKRRRESRSHYKRSKTSDCHSPVKKCLPKRLERDSRLSRRDIPRRAIPSKCQVAVKSTSYTGPRDKSCSDMSISPLSNLSNRNDHLDLSAVYSPDRHVSDMSISPFSDVPSPSRFSPEAESKDYNVSNTKVENLEKNIIWTRSPCCRVSSKSSPRKNISKEIPVCSSNNVSKLTSGTKAKSNNPLVMDLMKFHRDLMTGDFMEEVKNKSKTHMKTTVSEFTDKPTDHTEVNKVKQKTNITQSKQSKKEILLKRLQDINAAIERKKFT